LHNFGFGRRGRFRPAFGKSIRNIKTLLPLIAERKRFSSCSISLPLALLLKAVWVARRNVNKLRDGEESVDFFVTRVTIKKSCRVGYVQIFSDLNYCEKHGARKRGGNREKVTEEAEKVSLHL
jgi:hypothetical protein